MSDKKTKAPRLKPKDVEELISQEENFIQSALENLSTKAVKTTTTSSTFDLFDEEKEEEEVKTKKKTKIRKPKLDQHLINLAAQKQEDKTQQSLERQAKGEVNNSFEKYFLDQRLLKALYDNNFFKATDIQDKALNAILDQNNVYATAETGTGKTLAYLIPALQHLLDFPSRNSNCRILILAPTRDLVKQIETQAKALLTELPIKVNSLTGKLIGDKEDYDPEEVYQTFDRHQIVIATPGRLSNAVKEGFDLPFLDYLVVDEADRVFEIGLGKELKTICKNLDSSCKIMFFSATSDKESTDFFDTYAQSNVKITGNHSRAEKNKLIQYYYHADNYEHKINLLANIIKENNWQKVMVFVKKKETVTRVYKNLSNMKMGIRCTQIDGDMDQNARNRALGLFKEGKVQVIVTTDLLSRGIDIDNVQAVINFDLPFDGDGFVHRIGRTGRMGQKGIAISLVEGHDYQYLAKAMRYMKEIIPLRVFPGLEPQTSAPSNAFSGKVRTKKKKETKKKIKVKPKVKVRNSVKKNKGFPKKFIKK